jgi:hypothetical protein
MIKRFLPFIIASILAILLSFSGPAQAVIGGLGLLFAFLLCIFVSQDDESFMVSELKKFGNQLSDLKHADSVRIQQVNERARDVHELDRRLRQLEKNETGNDPFTRG